jgi:hypothetical protein
MILQGVEAATGVDEGIAKALEAIEDRLIADGQLEIELRRAVTDDEILTYYSTNSSRFATAPQSHLQRLEVPIDDNPVAVMGRLEQARVELNRGGLDLVDLARELGGEVDDLGWLDRPGLARVIPSSPTSILAVPAGEFGSPFTTSHSLVLLEVVDVETPRIPPLDEIRLKVVARYVVEERPRLEKRARETMLLNAGVEFEPSWLESFIRSSEKSPTG